MKQIMIYTDGACRGNPGPGGWAAILYYGAHQKIISGAEWDTTNNRMELKAAIEGITAVKEPCHIDIYTDSKYVQKGITEWLLQWKKRGWKTADKKPVKNADLWMLLEAAIASHDISFHWVKGHSGHPENELADEEANKAIDSLLHRK